MTLEAMGVHVGIGTATLLDDVSVRVDPGRIVAVVGPNGAGKTTLLQTLASDVRPTRGSIALDGRPLERWSGAELARRRAVMTVGGTVAFGFSAREVALMGRMAERGGGQHLVDEDLVDELLAALDCTALSDRGFATLSTGERQRVQLARAVAQVADVPDAPGTRDSLLERYLLLDEPTSSLDPAHQHTAMRLVRHEADAGRGVLVVLHDLNLAAAYADDIVLMDAARVVAAGPPARTMEAQLLEQVFGVPMLVMSHPRLSHPVVVARPGP